MKKTLVVLGLAFAPSVCLAQHVVTARDVVERIKRNAGVPWAEPTVDTYKDGDSTTRVTGIAVTMITGQASRGERCQPRNRKPRKSVSSPIGDSTITVSNSHGSQPAALAVR